MLIVKALNPLKPSSKWYIAHHRDQETVESYTQCTVLTEDNMKVNSLTVEVYSHNPPSVHKIKAPAA